MINIYPANRLENLVILLNHVLQSNRSECVLSEEVILVQSKGMQHWLNLKLAESQGVSMNLSFSLPMQFFWSQIRAILGKESVPEQSTYAREVLSWRINTILASDNIINNPLCAEATNYWFGTRPEPSNEEKRYQLACQLADLFEQYLLFRPDWIMDWESGQETGSPDKSWQVQIWQQLILEDAQHPITLLRQAVNRLKQHDVQLPERISLFGINTLPPLWLEFLSELGNHTQVHFFHLNPCVEYWGDLRTDKTLAKEQYYRWLNGPDHSFEDLADDNGTLSPTSNPLLSNLGAQGKEFLYLLQDFTRVEIPVFESPEDRIGSANEKITALQKIQGDILRLTDKRRKPEKFIDDSITVCSAHSALREVQALHDWLLHQINNDKSLTPKNILVMCPNVENYAPYVEAVFSHGWNEWREDIPPLPCSIADRTYKDSEPLVQAFISLLELPDSRFQVSEILSYLRLPALQDKFSFSEDDLLVLERWIKHAAIHWGLNTSHKQQILMAESCNEKFSWQQGLQRLLLGFAQGDHDQLYHEQLLLPDVEGDEALLLGRCFDLLEQLQYYSKELRTERSATDWKRYLIGVKTNLFTLLPEDFNAHQIIDQAIDDLTEFTNCANYEQKLPLTVVRDFLLNHFNQPEPGRQYMTGQVTFCSMLPMRSVPFRIIAVLGLNDGEFPRQRQPMGFDLMAMEPPRKGDRSRRGDDRYLFLEALISCRDKLYLSYQGRDIKTNSVREPSLVLKELMDYLEKAYCWALSKDDNTQIKKVPLQAFSQENYVGEMPSFASPWLKLIQPGEPRVNQDILGSEWELDSLKISAEQLVSFFENPSKQFAQTRLGLYLDNTQKNQLGDNEPFITTHLDRYRVQDSLIRHSIKQNLLNENKETNLDDLMLRFALRGDLPDTPNVEEELQVWKNQAEDFSETLQHIIDTHYSGQLAIESVQLNIANMELKAELPRSNGALLFWRLATLKGKDDIRLWIHHLIAQIVNDENPNTESPTTTRGFFRGEKNDEILTIKFDPISAAEAREILTALIQCWQEGMERPLLLNAALGQKHCQLKPKSKKSPLPVKRPMDNDAFAAFWQDNFQTSGLGSDPYVQWFWSDAVESSNTEVGKNPNTILPQWEGKWQQRIDEIYDPLYEHRKESKVDE